MIKKKKYILAIDQGTTGSRAFIFDVNAGVVASHYQEFKQYFPKPGWVEHDPMEILSSVEVTIKGVLKKARIESTAIAAIGITNQRETTIVWDRHTGKPIYPAIVWQCRRSSRRCEQLKPQAGLIKKITGLVVDAYFSATKIEWILKHVPKAKARALKAELCFGTVDSWLMYHLSGKQAHVTDMTNASRTMLFDIQAKQWSSALLKLFSIPEAILPQVLPSGSLFCQTVKAYGLSAGIPIYAVMGDQQAALYGQGCFQPGQMKNTYGTGCFMLLNTGHKYVHSKHGLLTTLAVDQKGKPVYALEGSVFMAGALIQWLRDGLGLIKNTEEIEKRLGGIKDTLGVYIVPAFVGLGAPYWNSEARGIITGLTRGVAQEHLLRAALEAMAYQTKDICDLMVKESGYPIKLLAVDGGACRNNFLMQFQSDILGCMIKRQRMIDSTVAGVAYLAGRQVGLYNDAMIAKANSIERLFKPRMKQQQVSALYQGWQKAIRQVLTS